jgi:surfeit locus 1 family protein
MLINSVDASLKEKGLFRLKGTVALMAFACLMTPLLLSLGFWQLQRAEDKQQLIDKQAQGKTERVNELADVRLGSDESDWSYRKVSVTGHYRLTEYLLLDNRTRDGMVGYEVISLFNTDDGKTVLINRGWVKAPAYRDQWPIIDNDPVDTLVNITITGSIYFPSSKVFTLSEVPIPAGWPKRVQTIDIGALSETLEIEIVPFTVRLNDDLQPGAFKTGWMGAQMLPEKHVAYAVQWFGLALVLIVMTALTIRKIGASQTNDS